MWGWLASFLGGPVINGLISGYKAKLESGNTSERIAADLAQRELAVQQREAEVNAQYKTALIGHWYEPVQLMAYILVFYIGKIYIWDAALGFGSTDAVRGSVGEWAGWIMAFLVGKRGFENVAKIIRR